MRHTVRLAQKLTSAFPRFNGLPHHLGGAYQALDNAPERSIHVKIHPRPRSLSESQQILHQLKRFGEIEVYRHLKYDSEAPAPNSLFVVYKDGAAAARAIQGNVIKFEYGAAPSTSPNQISIVNAKAGIEDALEEMQPDSHNEPCTRPGELIIRQGTSQHLSHIQRQHYYWPVTVAGVGTPSLAMFGSVPPGMHGLRDFHVKTQELSVRKRDGLSHLWDEKTKEKGWETLEELWEKGNQNRATKTAEIPDIDKVSDSTAG